MTLVLATRNPGKISEIKALLPGVRVAPAASFPGCPEPEETGRTFEENALIKARTVVLYTGRTALADDSGLEVDALDGRPASARQDMPGRKPRTGTTFFACSTPWTGSPTPTARPGFDASWRSSRPMDARGPRKASAKGGSSANPLERRDSATIRSLFPRAMRTPSANSTPPQKTGSATGPWRFAGSRKY